MIFKKCDCIDIIKNSFEGYGINLENRIVKLENEIKNLKHQIDLIMPDSLKIKNNEVNEKETFDFMTAVKHMEDGCKVFRKSWKSSYGYKYLELYNDYICDQNNDEIFIDIDNIMATDWEIVE